MEKVTIGNVELVLSHPVKTEMEWIGQGEPIRQLAACWMVLEESDIALTPRIIGLPGIGKTTLAMAAARQRNQDVYVMQCTSDTRPEDLLVSPVLSQDGKISYHASPLLSAAIKGGVAILDEGNRMSEKSWASLAGLFDHRRMVESIVAGITVTAHADFRAAVTMNEDSSTFEIPDYIMSRLQPGIRIPFPQREDELRILSYSLPFSSKEVLDICVDYLQRAHELDLPYSVRDGINAMRYTLKLLNSGEQQKDTQSVFNEALKQILGDEALDLEKLASRRKNSGEHLPSMNLGDFFFPDDEDLNPDNDEEY
ncbi:AAA family ATPase [Chitinispirillales bacterium ANBcel5]|uniref:AAA family ATPase n=1 Tax=Cellulosispirillum alkaliphilum TaxID=3039283 RepID=UPI002A50EEA4|nr:AAA family ATPase [Chitinispirillales bacterium ANBcel5]